MNLYIGLLSGTSMDGIDAAIVDTSQHQLVHGITIPYAPSLLEAMQQLITKTEVRIADLLQVHTRLGRAFAEAVLEVISQSKIRPLDIKAIGSHGQTICHNTSGPYPYTLQLGCPHTIAERTGLTTVADFRTRDLCLGGQGAPLAPLYHERLFSHLTGDGACAVINIGGISNITWLEQGKATTGWDLGPGSCLLDAWIALHRGLPFDEDGAWAAEGRVIPRLLEAFVNDPMLVAQKPKSFGREYFSHAWLQRHLQKDYQPVDIQSTLLALTAQCITDTIQHQGTPVAQVIVCGGGARNKALLRMMQAQLPSIKIQTTDAFAVSADYIEAMLFAWLAEQALLQKPFNLQQITGSTSPVFLGAIYPGSRVC